MRMKSQFTTASVSSTPSASPASGSRSQNSEYAAIVQLLWGQERRGALVLDQEHQEFRRLGGACVPVDDMNIARAFIEALSWRQCHLFSTLQLHHDGALQHVNKRMCIVSVDRRRIARRMLDCDHQSFLARKLRKILGHEWRDLGFLSQRRAGREAQKNQRNESDHNRLFQLLSGP